MKTTPLICFRGYNFDPTWALDSFDAFLVLSVGGGVQGLGVQQKQET